MHVKMEGGGMAYIELPCSLVIQGIIGTLDKNSSQGKIHISFLSKVS